MRSIRSAAIAALACASLALGGCATTGADELPPEASQYGDLELYLTSLNNGLKFNVPGIRH